MQLNANMAKKFNRTISQKLTRSLSLSYRVGVKWFARQLLCLLRSGKSEVGMNDRYAFFRLPTHPFSVDASTPTNAAVMAPTPRAAVLANERIKKDIIPFV